MAKTSVSKALVKAMSSIEGVDPMFWSGDRIMDEEHIDQDSKWESNGLPRVDPTKHVGVLGEPKLTYPDLVAGKGYTKESDSKDLSQPWDPTRYVKEQDAKYKSLRTENLTQAVLADRIASEVCKGGTDPDYWPGFEDCTEAVEDKHDDAPQATFLVKGELGATFDESWVCGYYEHEPNPHSEVFARTINTTWDPVAHIMATEEEE